MCVCVIECGPHFTLNTFQIKIEHFQEKIKAFFQNHAIWYKFVQYSFGDQI